MKELIFKELRKIEAEKDVKILYACESGSRAWGFNSSDSDYDVRFIYIHKINWYLSVNKQKDTIEKQVDKLLDISGWDLQKSFLLLKKSNPTLLEWFQSPIVYIKDNHFFDEVEILMKEYCSPVSCFYHYWHVAKGNFRDFLKGDYVKIKKYLYVIRPILSCLCIKKGIIPIPLDFDFLIDNSLENEKLKNAIRQLVNDKIKGFENEIVPRIEILSNFIEIQLKTIEPDNLSDSSEKSYDKLNDFFIKILKTRLGGSRWWYKDHLFCPF